MAKVKFQNGFKLAQESWKVLSENRQLLIFPLLSTLGLIGVSIVFALPFFAVGTFRMISSGEGASTSQTVLSLVVAFFFYLANYTVVIFSNTALVGTVMMYMRGEKPTVSDGFKIASERLSQIIVYAAISATVGMIARGIAQAGRESKNIVVAIIASIIGGTILGVWNLVTFLVIPVLVIENVSAIDALKRSWELFKKTWGENVIGGLSLGFLSCLLTLAAMVPGIVLLTLGGASGSVFFMVVGVLALIVGIGFVGLLSGALNGIFQAALYTYATNGETGGLFDTDLLKNAFIAK